MDARTDDYWLEVPGIGPLCDQVNQATGREICHQSPRHRGDHDDDQGTTWVREDN